jgi:dTDP-4-amino-4,6-dideoxygalactose transaminase
MNLVPFHRPLKLSVEETETIKNKIDSCLDSGILTNNTNVRELEECIKELHNIEYAIATSSCSQGLIIALQSLIETNKKVPLIAHTQSFTWFSTVYAIITSRRTPIYHDIDPDLWNMKQDYKYKLAVPVHTFGNVSSIESKFKVYDGAHALGTKLEDIGDATVLSLAPTKLITSIEGGIILTNDSKLAQYATNLRDKVSRMSEIHAIFGNTYLNHLEEVLSWKKEVYNYYRKHLDGIFQKTADSSNYNTIGMLTSLKIPEHIEIRKYYEPIQLSKDLPNTEAVYRSIICLPSWYGCPYEQIVEDINNLNKNL